MRHFLRNHTNTILVFLAVVFLAVIVGYFTWGIGYAVTEVNEANTGKASAAAVPGFNLNAAAAINYRGVAPEMPVMATSTNATTTATSTATSMATTTVAATTTATSTP